MNRKDKMVASQPIKRINGGSAADKKALSREALLSPEGLLSGGAAALSAAQRLSSLRSSYFIGLLLLLLGMAPGGGSCYAQEVGAPQNRWFFSGKTNVALLGLDAIANVEAECFLPVAGAYAFSINLPVMWSPYTVSSNWKYRLFALQPEFRWWLSNAERWWLRQEGAMKAHFVGVHTHLAWFNVAVNGNERYQGKQGAALPLWGVGVSYGYALLLPWWKGFGAEFTLGLGYAHISYDVYHNTRNGAKYATGVEHYWGVTRLGIALTYQL